jgi:hypothetical protein
MKAAKSIDRRDVVKSFVAFIDLLGFGQMARDAQTSDDLQRLHQTLDVIRHQFEFRPSDPWTKEEHKAVAKRVLMFSDCVVISIPLRSQYARLTGTFDLFAGELWSIALSQAACVIGGHFVRGAVDLGLWYYKHDFLISPALARAYQLEGKVQQPVIAITNALHEFMSDHPERRRYSRDLDPMKYLFRTYQPISGKPIRYLDYIGILLGAVTEQASTHSAAEVNRRMRMLLSIHARSIRIGHANAPQGPPKAKFGWLAEYHNSVVRSHAKGSDDLLVAVNNEASAAGVENEKKTD